MIKSRYFILIFLSTLFFLLGLSVLFTSMYKLYDEEELYIGTIAKELIEGPILPLFDYQAYRIQGGTLVSGILAVPFFLLFGQSYFSLKLLALCFSSATLVLWYLFLCEFFNRRVAVLASILFILAPPFYTKLTLMSYGKHCESNLFTIMAIFIFYQIFFKEETTPAFSNLSQRQKGRDKLFHYALFGLVNGFAMYFDYIFFITLATCFLFWFIFDKRFVLRKSFLVFLIFFLFGFSPQGYFKATHGFKDIRILGVEPNTNLTLRELFFSHTPLESLNKLIALLTRYLPDSFCFENFKNIQGRLISNLYYLVFIVSFCALIWLNRKIILKLISGIIPSRRPNAPAGYISREAFILACPVIFFLLYSFSHYSVKLIQDRFFDFYGFERLVVLFPFIFVTIALFLDKLWSWKNKNRISAIISFLLVLFLILSGLSGHDSLITINNFGNHSIYEGYSYLALGNLIGKLYGKDISKTIYLANKVSKQYRPYVFQGIGIFWGRMFYKKPAGIDELMVRINQVDLEYRYHVLVGLGMIFGWEFRDDIPSIRHLVNKIEEEYKPYLYDGVGEIIGFIFGDRIKDYVSRINKIDEKYRSDCYRGLGEAIGKRFGQDMAKCVWLIDKVKPEYRPYAFEGLGRNLIWRYKYYLKKTYAGLQAQIPEQYRIFFSRYQRLLYLILSQH